MFPYRSYNTKSCVEVARCHKHVVFLGKHASKIVLGACLAKTAGDANYNKVLVALDDAFGIVVVTAVDSLFNGSVHKICKQQIRKRRVG